MRRTFLIAALATACILVAVSAHAEDDFGQIRDVVQKYLDGTSQGKPSLVREAFLPSLEVQYLSQDDKLLRREADDYINRIEHGVEVPRVGRIISIDAAGKSATAKVEIDWNNRVYTDYMLLLKVEGNWRISNKIATWREK